ncbi:MAG: PAS domain S-box protein, partial [Chitinophagaceae bacterium]
MDDFAGQYKNLFERTSDLIHFVSVEGIIMKVNGAWLSTLEYSEGEVLGHKIFEFLHPDCLEEFKTYRHQIINNINPGVIRTSFVTKAGKTINLEGLVSASLGEGELKYTSGVFRDITAKVIAQKRLQTFFNSAPDAIVVINHH